MKQEALNHLLTKAAGLGPEYGDALSSHLPMALTALHRLGATDARLGSFFDRYAARWPLAPNEVPLAVPADPWGRIEAFASQRLHWQRALAGKGRDLVLRQALPRLMQGVAGVAFHGLIRVAYAVEAGHEDELAAALAYWVCRWQPLSRPKDALPLVPAEVWVDALRQAPPGPPRPGRLITDRLAGVVSEPSYARWAGRVQLDGAQAVHLPAMLAGLALQRYLRSRNFTVLHLVTSGHALRTLRPWLDAEASGHYADAFAAAWLSARTDPAQAPLADPGWDWPAIVQRAVAQDDDHVIKLVHSCLEEEQAYGGPDWRHAAALVVQAAG
jgi:hypothetical protein